MKDKIIEIVKNNKKTVIAAAVIIAVIIAGSVFAAVSYNTYTPVPDVPKPTESVADKPTKAPEKEQIGRAHV